MVMRERLVGQRARSRAGGRTPVPLLGDDMDVMTAISSNPAVGPGPARELRRRRP